MTTHGSPATVADAADQPVGRGALDQLLPRPAALLGGEHQRPVLDRTCPRRQVGQVLARGSVARPWRWATASGRAASRPSAWRSDTAARSSGSDAVSPPDRRFVTEPARLAPSTASSWPSAHRVAHLDLQPLHGAGGPRPPSRAPSSSPRARSPACPRRPSHRPHGVRDTTVPENGATRFIGGVAIVSGRERRSARAAVGAFGRAHPACDPDPLRELAPGDPRAEFADYAALWQWSVDELESFWDIDRRVLRRAFRAAGRAGARPAARCRAPSGSRARAPRYAEHVFRGQARRGRRASATPPSCASLTPGPGAGCARDCRDRGRPARAGRAAGRPGGGLHAQHPRDGGRVLGLRLDRRDLVLGGARVRGPQRGRPLRPDRAQGAVGDRRLPLRGQGLRPHRDRGHDRRRDAVIAAGGAPRVSGRHRLGGRLPGPKCELELRPARRSTTRCGCSTARARPGCPNRSCTARAGS